LSDQKKKSGLDLASLIIKIALFAILVGFVLTLATLLVPITVPTAMDVDDMRFGKPFPFMIQSFSGLPNEEAFPIKCIPKFTERYSTVIDMWMFLASFGVNSVIAAGVIVSVRAYLKRRAKKNEDIPQAEVIDGFAVTENEKDLT
jgi:hypothetical protein